MGKITRIFEVLSVGMETILNTKREKLVVNVLIENGEVLVPIDDQFRKKFKQPDKKYALFNTTRLQKIRETKPRKIEVEYTGQMERPFRVLNHEISTWFERVKNHKESE